MLIENIRVPAINFRHTSEALLMIETLAALTLFKTIRELRKLNVLRFFLDDEWLIFIII